MAGLTSKVVHLEIFTFWYTKNDISLCENGAFFSNMAILSIYVNFPGCIFIDLYRYSLVKLNSYLTEPAVSEKVRGW